MGLRKALGTILGVAVGGCCVALSPLMMAILLSGVALLRPFSNFYAKHFISWVAKNYWSFFVFVLGKFSGIKIKFHGDPIPNEKAFLISNHASYTDWVLLMVLASKKGCLGFLRFFVKRSILYLPILGAAMRLAGFMFMERKAEAREQNIARITRQANKLTKSTVPIWLCLYPEGTRVTPKKFEAAQAHALDNDLHVPTQTLVPRSRGFMTTMRLMRSVFDAVYDVTLVYDGKPPSPVEVAGRLAKDRTVHIHLRRFPVEDIPVGDEEVKAWLFERWAEKDRLIEAAKEDPSVLGPEVFHVPDSMQKKKEE